MALGVLVDTSVWIDYFGDGGASSALDQLIDEDLVCTNRLILAELIPFLKLRRQQRVIGLLKELRCLDLRIQWGALIETQYRCLRSGANGVGIPDLIIAQNAQSNRVPVYSLDKHFSLIGRVSKLRLFAATHASG